MAGDITKFAFRFRSDVQRMMANKASEKAGVSLNAWLQDAVDRLVSGDKEAAPIARGTEHVDMSTSPAAANLNIPGVSRGADFYKDSYAPTPGIPRQEFAWNPAIVPEVPICGKTWWEDGEQWECLMDKGHKEAKHGLRGMVRSL